MKKSKSAGKFKSSSQKFNAGGVTINDFANSEKLHSKVRKPMCNTPQKEKNIEKVNSDEDQLGEEDNNYPIDIWHLIGEHISPDQVGVFAQICTTTYLVTQSANFWFNLYKRYCLRRLTRTSSVPASLLPSNIKDKCGLRAHVIRALHYTYFPRNKNLRMLMNNGDPHNLVNSRCTAMWREEGKEGVRETFYFKLQECKISKRNFILSRLSDVQNDQLASDINYNNEKGCKTLKVFCAKNNLIPQVEGLILQSVLMTLSPDLKHYRLLLNFGSCYLPKTPTHTVVLNAVFRVEIIDWWQTNYPYQEMKRECKIKLPPTIDSWELI